MGMLVNMGALMMCTFGVAPSSLVVLPIRMTVTGGTPQATIMDFAPFVNILPFGMCTSPANPEVISAFGAPMPCVPFTVSPWITGAVTAVNQGIPMLTQSSILMCNWAGVISIVFPGQVVATYG